MAEPGAGEKPAPAKEPKQPVKVDVSRENLGKLIEHFGGKKGGNSSPSGTEGGSGGKNELTRKDE